MSDLVFVFGSNLSGRHGKGAALAAKKFHGAVEGCPEGPTGSSYAIPTKDKYLKVRFWEDILLSVDKFLSYAKRNPDKVFQLTPVGCGLAGYRAKDLLKHLQEEGIPVNVLLTSHWVNDHFLGDHHE